MTLHWWMHWFWVTSLLAILAGSGRTTAAPQSEELQHITTDIQADTTRHSERQGRAMYYSKPNLSTVKTTEAEEDEHEIEGQALHFSKPVVTTTKMPETNVSDNVTDKIEPANVTAVNITDVNPSVQWTPVNATDLNITKIATANNMTINNNLTDNQNTTFAKKRNLTRPDFVKDETSIEGVAESKIVTEKPLSLETTFLQTRIPPNVEFNRRVVSNEGGMDTGAIAGISFAALVLAALAGSTAFVLYRRRYLNKPQTLNDKCSNPDSSGYLDDSTIRDNSEEMYSLDNDSFLNSLEAMTIQNYWTDTVKHTKL